MTAEEYFSAEDYEWLVGVAGYYRDDPNRFVFADDGDCAEVCGDYATRIVDGDWYWFLDMLQNEGDDVARYANEPDYGRCLVLCLRYCIDVHENVHAMRWMGFLHQIGRFVEHDAHEAARLYKMPEMKGDCQRTPPMDASSPARHWSP